VTGARSLRVDWVPGSDALDGTCWCGASARAEDPATLWAWLLAHPDHPDAPGARPVPPAAPSLADRRTPLPV
jgi:hypothetical protein